MSVEVRIKTYSSEFGRFANADKPLIVRTSDRGDGLVELVYGDDLTVTVYAADLLRAVEKAQVTP